MSTVRAPPLLRGLVDLDVLHNQVLRVETLGIRVGLGVPEQRGEELGRLDGPAGLAHTELLACCKPIVSIFMFLSFLQCILAHGQPHPLRWAYVPWAVRPVLPA